MIGYYVHHHGAGHSTRATAVARACAAHGDTAPARLVLTHPEAWSSNEIKVLLDAAAQLGLSAAKITTISEPQAAAHYYSRAKALQPGQRIAVFDFGGGTFAGFAGAPHVAGIATRDTEEVRTRMIAEIAAIMDDRERYFRAHGIDSMDTYRRGRLEGRYDDGYGDVFLVIDGWPAFVAEFPDLEPVVQDLAGQAGCEGFAVCFCRAR